MAGTNNNDFMLEQEKALERMREMSRRSQLGSQPHKMPPAPPFVKLPDNKGGLQKAESKKNNENPSDDASKKPAQKNRPDNGDYMNRSNQGGFGLFGGRGITSLLGDMGIPISGGLMGDPDTTLILGILLILSSEKSDRFLLLALLYILI